MIPIIEKFITVQRSEAEKQGKDVEVLIKEKLSSLSELVGGYDFAKVIAAYWRGYNEDNEELKAAAVRYLRGEYSTRTEARNDLDVRTIIDDSSVYDHLKLLARFVVQAGYKGLIVNLDEMVNLYKISNQRSRSANYEQILRILNDCLQGSAEYLGFLLGGTPEFLIDPRKGLYSYEALHSRLAENSFAQIANVVDYTSPVLMLENLHPEELYVLLCNIRNVFAGGDKEKYLLPDEALTAFLQHCSNRIGDAYFRTPRNTIKAFTDLLAILAQNPDLKWQTLIEGINVANESDPSLVTVKNDASSDKDDSNDEDALTAFTL